MLQVSMLSNVFSFIIDAPEKYAQVNLGNLWPML
jgi:hypothetical protein